MVHLNEKAQFLRKEYIPLLRGIAADAPALWGKMNIQQMVEHMTDYVGIAYGARTLQRVTPPEDLPKMQAFLTSEKPFRENTPNVLMPAIPRDVIHPNMDAAIDRLGDAIRAFFAFYKENDGTAIGNPFFGDLNYDMQVQLLYKHATHHLRQFGISHTIPVSE